MNTLFIRMRHYILIIDGRAIDQNIKKYQFLALEAREFIQIISSSSISQHFLKIVNMFHENISSFYPDDMK